MPREREKPIQVRTLTRSDWPAIERLFGPRGIGGCWCMWWRVKGGKTWQACKGERNRAAFQALVQSGSVHGALAHVGDEPVGWCNFGPRADFMRIDGSRALKRNSAARRWSVACFYVRTGFRRRGVAQLLLGHAVEEAFRQGAEEIEGYPKEYGAAPTAPASFVWTGLPAMFEKAGFRPVPAEGSQRIIYVKRR